MHDCVKHQAGCCSIVGGRLTAWNFSSAKGRHFEIYNARCCARFNFQNACFCLFPVIPSRYLVLQELFFKNLSGALHLVKPLAASFTGISCALAPSHMGPYFGQAYGLRLYTLGGNKAPLQHPSRRSLHTPVKKRGCIFSNPLTCTQLQELRGRTGTCGRLCGRTPAVHANEFW